MCPGLNLRCSSCNGMADIASLFVEIRYTCFDIGATVFLVEVLSGVFQHAGVLLCLFTVSLFLTLVKLMDYG